MSFDMPEYTADCDGTGVLRMLDAIRAAGLEKSVRFYQASTSELYGKVREVPQSETTPFYPRSPYAGRFEFFNMQQYERLELASLTPLFYTLWTKLFFLACYDH